MNKQVRRHLRHARIGQSSDRPALTLVNMRSRLLCVEFQLSEDEEPVEIFFRPIPSTRVMELQGLSGKDAISAMLQIVSEFVVDPQTGNPLAGPSDWDAFGVDGIQTIVSAMVDGARGGKGRSDDTEAGPTTPAAQDAMTQAALEIMQGDPEMAAAFQKASQVLAGQAETEQQAETAETETTETTVEDVPMPISAPNGTSDETPSLDSPSSSTDT